MHRAALVLGGWMHVALHQTNRAVTKDRRQGGKVCASLREAGSSQVFTPKLMAVGVGSSRCEWRFDVGNSPLYGKDIETWSLLALPKTQRALRYRMRFYVVTRLAFVPQRFESSW